MSNKIFVSKSHPRYFSLLTREKLVEGFKKGIVAPEGLIAQGRAEAFDYILGEKTLEPARKAIEASVALSLLAKNPVISVNGNTAILAGKEIIKLARILSAKIEINLFYRTKERQEKIKKFLELLGAENILGVEKKYLTTISELMSERRWVDKRGIFKADVVFVPLEDGDRTEALINMGKKVIAVDLNPFSRTSQKATITIVDNIVRAMPILIKLSQKFKKESKNKLSFILKNYENKKILKEIIKILKNGLGITSKR